MSSPSYTLRVLQRVSEVSPAAWDSLISEDGSPFVEHAWLTALEETGCVGRGTGWTPAHISLWDNERLVAVAPSYLKEHSEGEFVFDWAWAEFADRIGAQYYPKIVVAVPFTPASGDRILVAQGEDRAVIARLVAESIRSLCRETDGGGVHVLFPREDEARHWENSGFLRREGFQFQWFRDGASGFDDYLARFSSKQRNQIKRELRCVHEAGIRVEPLAADAYTPAVARSMYEFYSATVDKHGMWGRLYLRRSFFEQVARTFRDRLAWVVASDAASGNIVGGAFNVAKGRRLFGRYWGTCVDVPFLHFAVCYYAGIRYCLERGLDVFEPGAGGEHKRARGFVPTVTHSAHWLSDARLMGALAPWLARERARVRSIVEGEI